MRRVKYFRKGLQSWYNSIEIIDRKTGYPNFLWPTEYKIVTQAFGINPQWYNKYNLPGHEGIDMRALTDTRIFAAWSGRVSRVGWHDAYGNHIRLKHYIFYHGEVHVMETIYAHFSQPSHLKLDTWMKRGEVIGLADSTGNSSGSHLHFGLKIFTGSLPDTYYQNAFDWPHYLVDPTMFFKELREGYE